MNTQTLRKLRRAAGLSQAKLAALIGVTQATISYIETGARRLTEPTADRLAQALGLEPAEMILLLAATVRPVLPADVLKRVHARALRRFGCGEALTGPGHGRNDTHGR